MTPPILRPSYAFLPEKRVLYDKTETFKIHLGPETYCCRGLLYSANLPTEMKIRYFGTVNDLIF